MRERYEALANAIVLQAVKDWRNGKAGNRAEVEAFFRSRLFGTLTRINPEVLIKRLREENAL